MSTPIPNLGYFDEVNLTTDQFTAEELAQAELIVQRFVADYAPSLNLAKGSTLYDLLIRPRSLHAVLRKVLDEKREATQSLKGVIDNPGLASDEVVDAILSNKGITRKFGNKATGTVRVNVSRSIIYSIPTSMQFATGSGVNFFPTANYRATITPLTESDLQLYPTDSTNTQFYFLVPVIAENNGLDGRIADLTELTITNGLPNLIIATAFGNFQGGQNDETNNDFIAREPEAMAAKNQVSRTSISGTLKDQFTFVRDVSVQGMNDLAMSRNSANILSVKLGGYADVYVRTSQNVLTTVVPKTATLLQINGVESATYSVQIDRNDVPGSYFVSAVNSSGNNQVSSYIIQSEIKAVDNDVDGGEQFHLIPTAQDGVYSSYQTSTVIFNIEYDAELGTVPEDQFLQTIAVDVQVTYMPGIKEIQEFMSDPNRGVVLSDYLVKAGIPCFVRLSSVRVNAIAGTSGEAVRTAIYDYINSIPFGGTVRVDEIVTVAKSISGVESVDLPIVMTGDIFAPDGTTRTIRSQNVLEIPSIPDLLIVPQTVSFFAELPDIPIAMIDV